jgi:uncharacterized protein YeeX (DUF496 family)
MYEGFIALKNGSKRTYIDNKKKARDTEERTLFIQCLFSSFTLVRVMMVIFFFQVEWE